MSVTARTSATTPATSTEATNILPGGSGPITARTTGIPVGEPAVANDGNGDDNGGGPTAAVTVAVVLLLLVAVVALLVFRGREPKASNTRADTYVNPTYEQRGSDRFAPRPPAELPSSDKENAVGGGTSFAGLDLEGALFCYPHSPAPFIISPSSHHPHFYPFLTSKA